MKLLKLSLVLAFLLTATLAHSQIGVRVGVNIATLSYDPDDFTEDLSSIIGLNLGVLMEFPITESISIQPELHFIQKGAKDKFEDSFGTEETTITFNYLELAIMAKMNLVDFGNDGSLYVGLTPHLGYGLNGKIKVEIDGESETDDIEFDEDGLNRMDFGVGLGAGVTFGNIFIDARYNLGLSNLNDDDDFGLEIKHRGFLIGLGYKF